MASLFLEEEEVKVRWSFVRLLGVFFGGGGDLWVEGIHTYMGRKEEKGMESTQQEGEKGETMQVVEVTTHDDDDRAGETGHRSKDEDEVWLQTSPSVVEEKSICYPLSVVDFMLIWISVGWHRLLGFMLF